MDGMLSSVKPSHLRYQKNSRMMLALFFDFLQSGWHIRNEGNDELQSLRKEISQWESSTKAKKESGETDSYIDDELLQIAAIKKRWGW